MIDPGAVKSAINAADLIGQTVRLRKAPGGVQVGVCPAHNEKSASFYVYPGDRGFHCFGCGFNGSVIDWVMWRDGVDFKTALRDLAAMAGLTDDAPTERPILAPKDPRYPQPFWRPVLPWGGQHLMQGGLPVIILHDFPGRRLYIEIAELMDDHDVLWFPRIDAGSGQTAAAEQMDLAPIARQAVWIAPTRDPMEARRARDLERLIVRWRGYAIMAATRRRQAPSATTRPAEEVNSEPAAFLHATAGRARPEAAA